MTEEKKNPYAKHNKYNAKTYDAMNARVKKDGSDGFTIDEVRSAAESAGESLNTFILNAVRERLQQTK